MHKSSSPPAAPLSRKGRDSRDRYYLMYELFHSITSTLDTEKALNLIIDAAVKITGATNGSLILVNWEENLLEIQVSRGFLQQIESTRLKVGEGITGWVAEHGEPLLVSDVSREPRYVQLNAEIQSELAVPLLSEGRVIGVINVDSTRPAAFDEEDLDLLTLLSKQSARVIENGQLYDMVRSKVEELSTLIDINTAIASSLSLDKILPQIVERTARLMQARICSVMLLSDDGEELVLQAQTGGSAAYSRKPNLPIESSAFDAVLRKGRPLQVGDMSELRDDRIYAEARGEGMQAMLAVPLLVRGRPIGLIKIYKSHPHRFGEDQIRLLKTLADQCAIAIENARLYSRLATLEEEARRAERMAAVGELAVGIAHEIRNPLTIVKMILASGNELDDRDREVISEELERMNQIITHLLDYTRPREPHREYCRVNRALENALLLLGHQLDSQKISVERDLAQGLPKIHADPVQLQQVFLNLLLNSCEALPPGGTIRVRTRAGESALRVEIRDDGPGLPETVRENLFTPFITTKPKGLGLGLSICKRIIEAHGGELQMKSPRSGGTRALIILPVEASSEELSKVS